eukprot:gene4363-20585_t
MGRIYDKCPEHLQISLRSIISQKNLLLGHVIIGFSRDGKYILSYQCRIIDEMEDGCPYLGYKYSLNWWEFHFKMPSKKAHLVPLFVGEDIGHELHLLICQPPCGKYLVVHGNSSSLRSSVAYAPSPRSAQSSTCYLTVAPSPSKSHKHANTASKTFKIRKAFALHLKYELVPPYPPFFPSVNLKLDDTILINSGDLVCALSAYRKDDGRTGQETISGLFEPLNCNSDCFCHVLSNHEKLKCTNQPHSEPSGCGCDVSEPGFQSWADKTSMINKDSLSNQSVASGSDVSDIERCKDRDEIDTDDGARADDPDSEKHSSPYSDEDSPGHTSCYLFFYSERNPANSDQHSPPFDCTSTAFPLTITTDQGTNVPQIASHRCSTASHASSHLKEAVEDADVIVKQVVFDAEQFLDRKLRSMDSIKERFVSLKDYDMQLVQVCAWNKEVVILLKALVHLNGKLGDRSSSPRLSTYMTGFLLSWNIKTGTVLVLDEQPLFEYQKQKCKSRSICHGLEQAVDLRRKNFVPTCFPASVLSFSNHTVFSGKSMKYLLHPFQPLAIVM